MIHELASILADFQPFHTETQIDRFIVGLHGGTPWGMYRQTVRELHTRWEALKSDYETRDEAQEAIEEGEVPEAGDGAETRAGSRSLRLARAKLESVSRMIRDREREFRRFFATALALRERLGPMTPERSIDLEAEFWEHQATVKAALDVMAYGRPQPSTLEFIFALPVEIKVRILDLCAAPDRLAAWFRDFEPPRIDIGPFLPAQSVRSIVQDTEPASVLPILSVLAEAS